MRDRLRRLRFRFLCRISRHDFSDAELCIPGSSWPVYARYCRRDRCGHVAEAAAEKYVTP